VCHSHMWGKSCNLDSIKRDEFVLQCREGSPYLLAVVASASGQQPFQHGKRKSWREVQQSEKAKVLWLLVGKLLFWLLW
jgi:hypothetical protein